MGGSQIHSAEVAYRFVFVDVRLFRHEASAAYPCRTYQCHASGHDARGCDADFGERLNLYQWIGVLMAIISFFMLSRSGKKEGIDFTHNRWIWFVVLAAVLGTVSGLYDKFLMGRFNNMQVQAWYNIYQFFLMGGVLMFLWWPKRKTSTPFHWDWCIILISVFLSAADFVYFYALTMEDSMISIVSMVRRGSVIVSFLFGAMLFHEKNLKSKVIDLILVLIGMFFLYLGSR